MNSQPAGSEDSQNDANRGQVLRAPRGRLSALNRAVALTLVLLIIVLDFIIQNLHSTNIHFFTASFGLPVGVAIIVAAVGGGVLVMLVSSLRIGQLRLRFRQHRRGEDHGFHRA